MNYEIRPIKVEEAEIVVHLWDDGVEEIGYQLSETSIKNLTENMRAYANHEKCRCFVATVEDKIVGYVTCALTHHPIEKGTAGDVEELYVKPDFRQSKIAESLLKQAVGWLKTHGAHAIFTRMDKNDQVWIDFWHAQKWDQDMIIFAIYSNPGDDEAQAVWDSYQ